jgi:hypothetical protein
LGTLLSFTREAKSLGWKMLAPAKQKVSKMPATSAANLIHLKFYPLFLLGAPLVFGLAKSSKERE